MPEPKTTEAPAQPAADVCVHPPVSVLQQAPDVEAQLLVGVQEVATPENALEPVQPEAMVMVHAARFEQHAPLRALQGVDAQVEPALTKVLGEMHPDWMVTVQAPMPEQQAP